jgi:hypothetical protein
MTTTLLAMLILAVGADEKGGAEKPTLETLDTKQVQAFFTSVLRDPAKKKVWEPYQKQVVLDTSRLEYRRVVRDGEKMYAILWVVPLQKGVELDDTRQRELRKGLRAEMDNAVSQRMLLKSGTSELKYPILIDGKPDPEYPGFPAKKEAEPLPPPRPTRERYVWRFVPAPCGSCLAGWYVPVLVEPANKGQNERNQEVSVSRQRQQTVMAQSQPSTNGSTNGFVSTSLGEPVRVRRKPSLDLTRLRAADAPDLFYRGCREYWQRDYSEALAYLEAATKLADDARFWYFRALAERALGEKAESERSLARAVVLHREGKPDGESVGLALERVQGSLRMWIRDAQDNTSKERLSRR